MNYTKEQVEDLSRRWLAGETVASNVLIKVLADWLEQDRKLKELSELSSSIERIDEWSENANDSVPWTAIEDVCEVMKKLLGGEK